MPVASAQSLVTSAVALGYDALSDRDLRECLLVAAQNAGGGGGGSSNYYAAPGPPNANPPTYANIVVDINGRQWQFFNGGPWQ